MKRMRVLLTILLALCLMPLAAAATEEAQAPVTILLNGETMALPSGAQPWIDPDTGYAYVPFRDVFEALGATVTYEEETRKVTAVREDVTIEFSQNNTSFLVVNGEIILADLPITREGRILVPVRFAAQTLGAKVGWDSDSRTVLIADIPALVEARLGSYEIVGKLGGLTGIDPTRNYRMDMKLDMLADVADLLGYSAEGQVPVEGQLSAILGPDGFDGTGSVTADVSAMLSAVPGMSGNVTMTYGAQVIWNQKTGMFYLQSPAIAQNMGLSYYGLENPDAWLCFDYEGALDDMGLLGIQDGLTAALMGEETDWPGLAALLMELAADDYYLYSLNSYENMLDAMDTVNSLLEDSFYALEDGAWVNRYTLEQEGLTTRLVIRIAVNGDGTATGLSVSFEMGEDDNLFAAEITVEPNAARLTATMEGFLELTLDLEATWAPTATQPRTEPPRGEEVVDPVALREQYYQDMFERYTPPEPTPLPKEV